MRVLVTGANGFIGKNLLVHLAERKDIEVVCFTREHSEAELPASCMVCSLYFTWPVLTARKTRQSLPPGMRV